MFTRRQLPAVLAVPALTPNQSPQPITGVGVLRFSPQTVYGPNNQLIHGAEHARNLAAQIHQGSILVLPSARDHHGRYLWDFHIEAGDPGQVTIQRQPPDDDDPSLEVKS